MSTKKCRTCGIEKSLDRFYLRGDGTDRRRGGCIECRRGHSALASIKASAKHRGIAFDLSRSEYEEIIAGGVCEYCGFGLPKMGGVDRKDNSLGYIRDNCVPCCMVCNQAKSNYFTFDEMLRIGAVIRVIRIEREVAVCL
jgi:hypothetical protein